MGHVIWGDTKNPRIDRQAQNQVYLIRPLAGHELIMRPFSHQSVMDLKVEMMLLRRKQAGHIINPFKELKRGM